VDTPSNLLDGVQQGIIDAAILYSPHRRSGITTELVLEEELVAVSTGPCSTLNLNDYVYVDWGRDFASAHDARLPELSQATTTIGLGPLALRYILEVGGCGYFRARAVEPYLAKGQLHWVKKAPKFSYSLYAATSDASDPDLLMWARERLTQAAEMPTATWA
jgi:DNA-binding transcriptional LysR family regulator